MKKKIFFWSVFLSILFSLFLIYILGKKINPIIKRYATVEAERFATLIINHEIKDHTEDEKFDELFQTTKNNDGEIIMIDYNSVLVNQLLSEITREIQKDLLALENGNVKRLSLSKALKGENFPDLKNGIVCEVPMGTILSNSFLANMGPVIPIRLSFLGQVMSSLNTKVKSYGVNYLYIELSIQIEVRMRISMPTMTEEKIKKTQIPLSIKVIQGKIPNYLYGGIQSNSSSYSLPIE